MSVLRPFQGISVPPPSAPPIKRRYSVTSDVVAFRRCPRQYGAFRVHNYAPAHQTQIYFGTILHQVLDRCHIHYHGLVDPTTEGTLPDNGEILCDGEVQDYFDEVRQAQRSGAAIPPAPSDILGYFIEVESGLKSRGIYAVTPDLRLTAIRILQYFNHLEGPSLYPRVVDTEHRLQADQDTHILNGVVDLLVGADHPSHDPADFEIWDYKGSTRIGLATQDLQTYMFQMRVYARLYELKHGVRPQQAILYFLNELDGPTCPTTRPVNAILSVDIPTEEIQIAVDEFGHTVSEIEASRELDLWPPATPGEISENDCTICDLRWDCPTPPGDPSERLRHP